MRWTLPVLVGLVSVLAAGAVRTSAGWTGAPVTAEWRYPDFNTILVARTVLVGVGVELNPADPTLGPGYSIDLGDDTVTFRFTRMTMFGQYAFNGWCFTDTAGTIPKFTGYHIAQISPGITGLTAADLGFNGNSVWANFSGVRVAGAGDFIRLAPTFLPEPGAAWCLLALLGSLAGRHRR
jgi:hypothetical protein